MIPQPTGICYGKPATKQVRSLGGHGVLPNGCGAMTIERHGRRHWGVYDARRNLVCVCVYFKGAQEVVRRLTVVAR